MATEKSGDTFSYRTGANDTKTARGVVVMGASVLMAPGAAKRVTTDASSDNVQITATARAISIYARGGAMRYAIGPGNTIAADAATGHYLAKGERLEFKVFDPCWIAAIRSSDADADGVLEITELT